LRNLHRLAWQGYVTKHGTRIECGVDGVLARHKL
jgi:hypothetical protein